MPFVLSLCVLVSGKLDRERQAAMTGSRSPSDCELGKWSAWKYGLLVYSIRTKNVEGTVVFRSTPWWSTRLVWQRRDAQARRLHESET